MVTAHIGIRSLLPGVLDVVVTSLEQQIAGFLAENFLFSEDGSMLNSSTSFMDTEILDSTGILHLVMFVEQTFGVDVNGEEITPENLDSIDRVADFVRRKLG